MRRNSYIREYEDYEKEHIFRKNAERLAEEFFTKTIIENGIVRWQSNNHIPPTDILEFWNYLGYEFDYEQTLRIYNEEMDAFFDNYRKNPPELTDEDLFEMRAAYGPGAVVIDIITGEEIHL